MKPYLRARASLLLLTLIPAAVMAQGVATETTLKPVVVTGSSEQLDPTLPSTTASKTAEQLREFNLFNPEDAAAFAVGLKLFGGAILANKDNPLLSSFLPQLYQFVKELKAGSRTDP